MVKRVVAAYEDPIIRTYSYLRFKIFRQRFLEELGQYLPDTGRVLDVGCGFGLFSLYFAQLKPNATFEGFDLNARRIELAKVAAERLSLHNVSYHVDDACQLRGDGHYQAVYMLDVLHHVPAEAVAGILQEVHRALPKGGLLLVKDLDVVPNWQRWFSWALDKGMDPKTPVRYWALQELRGLLESFGFSVRHHAMVDILPYPHVLYVCHKT